MVTDPAVTDVDDRNDRVAVKIVAAMDRLARGRRSHRQAIASHHGLTPLQLDLLTTLADGPPPEPLVGRLARELGVSQPTITDSLGALEHKELVTRDRDDADRRRTAVALTAVGSDLVDRLRAAERELVHRVGALHHSDQEAILEGLLTLIARHVDAGHIAVARTCMTCHFHQPTPTGGHRCTLLELDLPPADLRVNCPEHEPAHAATDTSA